jgi:hypothetical protein
MIRQMSERNGMVTAEMLTRCLLYIVGNRIGSSVSRQSYGEMRRHVLE